MIKLLKSEMFLYLLFGGLTTLVNVVVYYLLAPGMGVDYRAATVLAWVTAVLFAFFTNKTYVFRSDQSMLSELVPFVGARLLSLGLDLGVMILLVEWLMVNDLVSKIIANVLVVLFNYVISKYYIFNGNNKSSYDG
ncbi:GtrA family protein [Halobacillus fulvus]|nr:GtrA family protein [Halobacillus fulvus]